MKQVFAPGCALMIYKPELRSKLLEFLNKDLGPINEHLTCCRYEPNLSNGIQVINVCPGCNKRFSELYEGISTISLWEVLAESNTFSFPDYNGKEMSILDACPTRAKEKVHNAIRTLLAKMNIKVIEPEKTKTKGTCCGDSFYGVLPVAEVKERMKQRADEMPCEDVVVHCVSCVKAMHIGGKKPRYIFDLLFGEDTGIGTFEPDQWHNELEEYIAGHFINS